MEMHETIRKRWKKCIFILQGEAMPHKSIGKFFEGVSENAG